MFKRKWPGPGCVEGFVGKCGIEVEPKSKGEGINAKRQGERMECEARIEQCAHSSCLLRGEIKAQQHQLDYQWLSNKVMMNETRESCNFRIPQVAQDLSSDSNDFKKIG